MEFQFYYSGYSPLMLYWEAFLLSLLMLLVGLCHVTADLEGQFCSLSERLRSRKPDTRERRKVKLPKWLHFLDNVIFSKAMVIKTRVSDNDVRGEKRHKFCYLSRIQFISQTNNLIN